MELKRSYTYSCCCVNSTCYTSRGKFVTMKFFNCREIWEQSKSSFQDKKMDIHTKLMSKYNQVPEWWFWCILVANITLTVFACEYYNEQLQLPWWGVILACVIAIFFTLPIGIITAITNQVNMHGLGHTSIVLCMPVAEPGIQTRGFRKKKYMFLFNNLYICQNKTSFLPIYIV